MSWNLSKEENNLGLELRRLVSESAPAGFGFSLMELQYLILPIHWRRLSLFMCLFYVNSDKSLLSSTYAAAFQARA